MDSCSRDWPNEQPPVQIGLGYTTELTDGLNQGKK